jgi:hypothetical protein
MTIAIKPTASGATIEQNGSTILTVDGSGNIAIANNLSVTGSSPLPTGPAFSAKPSTNQAVSAVTFTKCNLETEDFDTNSNFDNTTNYRFTPTVAGYYQCNAKVQFTANGSQLAAIYKNGTEWLWGSYPINNYGDNVSALIYMNGTTDYLEMYVYRTTSGTVNNLLTRFSAVLVRAA